MAPFASADVFLPDLDDILATARTVALPMPVTFRGIRERELMLFEGPHGWGEFGAFPEYDDVEASRWLAAAIEAAWSGFPTPVRDRVPVNATLPAVPPSRVAEVLARFGELDSITAVKVKVAEPGQEVVDDVERVAEVRRLLPRAGLRVDANGGWSVDAAVLALSELADYTLEYAEQPAAGIDGLRAVRQELRRREVPVLVAADESVRREEDPLRVSREDAADLLVVKASPLGGVRRALALVAEAGLPAVVSSALDSSVGLRSGLALAASLPELPYACGLGTLALMSADVSDQSLVPDRGFLAVRDVEVSAILLERHQAEEGRQRWWRKRLGRSYRILAARHRD